MFSLKFSLKGFSTAYTSTEPGLSSLVKSEWVQGDWEKLQRVNAPDDAYHIVSGKIYSFALTIKNVILSVWFVPCRRRTARSSRLPSRGHTWLRIKMGDCLRYGGYFSFVRLINIQLVLCFIYKRVQQTVFFFCLPH